MTAWQSLPPETASSEGAYRRLWERYAAPLDDPFAQALAAGAVADRFAWIFIAGYQAALRRVFGRLDGWSAFAVTEDRSAEQPLPGVTWKEAAAGYRIDGCKTWVAACQHIDSLVIKAGRGADARYFLVPAQIAGLGIEAKRAPRMLPDLSQGVAHFDAVVLPATALQDAAAVAQFGASEVLFIYTAFLASSWHRVPTERSAIEALLALATPLATGAAVERNSAFQPLDDGVQALRERLAAGPFADDADWQRDQTLVRMYAKPAP